MGDEELLCYKQVMLELFIWKFFGVLFICLLMSTEGRNLCTLREEIFAHLFFGHSAGINFRELGFTEDYAVINFREFSLTKDFAGINFRESALYKDFTRVYLTFALMNIFSMTLIYGFENNLSKN